MNLLHEAFTDAARQIYTGDDLLFLDRQGKTDDEGGLVLGEGLRERSRDIAGHMIRQMIRGNEERPPVPALMAYDGITDSRAARNAHTALMAMSSRAADGHGSEFTAAALVCAVVWQAEDHPRDLYDPAQIAAMYFHAVGKPSVYTVSALLDKLKENQR